MLNGQRRSVLSMTRDEVDAVTRIVATSTLYAMAVAGIPARLRVTRLQSYVDAFSSCYLRDPVVCTLLDDDATVVVPSRPR